MIYKMKLWQKIFIISFITSIFLFTFCGIFIIVSGHKLNFNFEKQNFEKKLTVFSKKLSEITDEKTVLNENELYKLITYFRKNNKSYYLTIYEKVEDNKDKIIYDTLNKKRQIPRYELSVRERRDKIYVEIIGDKKYMTSEINLDNFGKPLKIFLSKDVNHIYSMCDQQLERLFLLCVILSIGTAFSMLITSKILTAPINKINEAIGYVVENNYSYRLPVNNMDELNMLCNSFNTMSEAVEKNISNYKTAINNFTHEVKTPLTSIMGYADIIKNDKFSKINKKEAADYILQESKRLNSLINKIINFLTIDSGTVKKKKVLFSEIMEMSYLSVKASADIKEITIVKPDFKNTYTYGDDELLVVLIVNILDNAIKASYIGGKIEINYQKNKNTLTQLSIIDFGIGIPEDEIKNITEVFYMVDKSRSRTENSLGLGLAICTEILKSHNASFEIFSKIGEGTKIVINFSKNCK